MKEYICIDIGGTTIKYGILQEDKTFRLTGERPTEALRDGGPGILAKVREIIVGFLPVCTPEGICISTAGMVDCDTGRITYAAPLIPNYTGAEIKRTLEDAFGLPCEVENDVNCAGLAEQFSGAARGSRITLCLTVGTGIGGAILIDGKVFHGCSGSGCEVGYLHLPGGAFQDQAASSVLVKRAAAYQGRDPDTIDGKYVFAQAEQGDAACIRAIDEMADTLGMGIANICYVLNPEVVVLGGGIMARQAYLAPRIRRALDRYLIPSVARHTRLAFAENQNQAGMLGAYYHFRERHPV